jgi:tetratricopeptide (TPR) repeat protein
MANTKSSKEDKNLPKMDSKTQARLFDEGMAHFRKEDFAGARDLFAQVVAGPPAAFKHSAQMYLKMCERRTERAASPMTAEEHYTAGVAAINSGSLPQAEEHLRQALNADGGAGHYHYALALCQGLQGKLDACRDHLAKAIEIEPANRVAARNDPDFQPVARQSPIRELLQTERPVSG